MLNVARASFVILTPANVWLVSGMVGPVATPAVPVVPAVPAAAQRGSGRRRGGGA